jgi:peptidoglycan hydrolase-like protein with peptidoglycan-binding domain
LQDRLRTLGFLQGEADGVFGTETVAAVKAAQSNFQLEPDGIVGPATWRALLR